MKNRQFIDAGNIWKTRRRNKKNKKTKTKTKCGKGTVSTPKMRIDYTKYNVFGEAKCMFKC